MENSAKKSQNSKDFSLIERAKQGDEEALDALRKQFTGYLGILRARLPNYFSDEDKLCLFNEALWEAIQSYNPEAETQFSTWLYWFIRKKQMYALQEFKEANELFTLDNEEKEENEETYSGLEPLIGEDFEEANILSEEEMLFLEISLDLAFDIKLIPFILGIDQEEWVNKIKDIVRRLLENG